MLTMGAYLTKANCESLQVSSKENNRNQYQHGSYLNCSELHALENG